VIQMLIVVILSIGQVWSQDQMALRLNEKGILKIMEMALKYNTATESSRTFLVPQKVYQFTIPKSKLNSNQFLRVVNQISNLDLSKDFNFYLNTSDIKILGEVDQRSLSTTIINSHEDGFDVSLSISLPKITASGAQVSLCKNKKNDRECGRGLQATLSDLLVETKGAPLKIQAVLRFRSVDNLAQVRVISTSSNLETEDGPELEINFKKVMIPKMSLVINGTETVLNTSGLKQAIRNKKDFLASKLLNFVADFIASDFAEMVNVYLVNKQVATSWKLNGQDKLIPYLKYIDKVDTNNIDYTYISRPKISTPSNPLSLIVSHFADIVNNSQVELRLNKIRTPGNKDLELAGEVDFIFNGQKVVVNDRLGNRVNNRLPHLNLSGERDTDINLVISEPLINGALDVISSTGLFQDLLEANGKITGFQVKNLKIHFSKANRIYAVANAEIDLKKLNSQGVKHWFKNKVAAFLERNNNNAIIFFPIQLEITPYFTRTVDGGAGLDLYIKSPFDQDMLANSFGYPSNVDAMFSDVRQGVLEELKQNLGKFTDRRYSVDINKFINQAGVEFRPRMISVNQGAYLMINLDIIDIKFSSKRPYQY
jgi:hypothetical protein